MTKKFTIHGAKMTISKQNKSDVYYRVELEDSNKLTSVVYEKSFNDAVLYASEWAKNADERKKKHDLETNAIEEMIALDVARGTMLSLD